MIEQSIKGCRFHRCFSLAGKTVRFILILLSTVICMPASAEQFSIKCAGGGFFYYMTFDTDLKKSIYQVEHGGIKKGPITSLTKDEIRFNILTVGRPPRKLILNDSNKKITWLAEGNDETQQFRTDDCERTELRPVLSYYDLIAPETAPLRPPK
jgi:hypothetical protein